MLTKEESTTLQNFLDLAPDPEISFTFDELQGYLFGLAMTPGILLPSDWIPVIFGDLMPDFDENPEQVDEMHDCLIQVYSKMAADFQDRKLPFPFDLHDMDPEDIEEIYSWASGFEEALALNDELWDPEEYPELPEHTKQKVYHSLMTVEGLVDPTEVMDVFENLPDEAFAEVFPDMDASPDSREMQIQMFLLASLPLAVETLQNHARSVQSEIEPQEVVQPEAKPKTKKTKAKANTRTAKKSNIIAVDFKKKK